MSRLPPPTRKLPPEVRLGRSGVHGHGMFVRDFIPQGSRIIEYFGERITKPESRRREAAQLAVRTAGGEGCFYIFELNRRHDLDGRMAWNSARRINHSCAPNCESLNLRGRIWIVALRDLGAGEELTFDYGFDYADWPNHPCRCGATGCVGYIVNAGQRWRVAKQIKKEKGRRKKSASERSPS